jgi:hypothetical protein
MPAAITVMLNRTEKNVKPLRMSWYPTHSAAAQDEFESKY